MKKTALITGATSGIGRATAHEFAKHGINLILCGRRQERLDIVEHALEKLTDVVTLNFDVRDKMEVKKAISSIPKGFKQIDILINNAGNAHGLDPIEQGSLDDWHILPSLRKNQYLQYVRIGFQSSQELLLY